MVKLPAAARAASLQQDATWDMLRPGLQARGQPALLLNRTGAVVAAVPDDWIGQGLAGMVPEGDQPLVLAAFRHALQPGLEQRARARCISPDGATRWFDWHFVKMPGSSEQVLVSLHDVDDLRSRLGRLEEDVELIRDSEQMARMGTWYWDITKPHANWTPGLYRIYALDAKTHVPTYEDYLRRVHPDDVERVKRATEAAFNELLPYSHDERIKRPDGSWRHLHTWARPVLGSDGALVALQGVCWDITDRVAAEQLARTNEVRLQAVFDASEIGFAVLDDQGVILEANPALERLAGGRELVHLQLEDLVDPADAPDIRKRIAHPARYQGSSLDVQLELNEPRWIRLRLNAAHAEEEPVILAIFEDVTLEVVAQERAARIEALKEEGERQRVLLNIAAHELKNPLTPLLLRLHLLADGHLGEMTPRQADAVQKVEDQAKRLEGLIGDLLDVGRLGAGMKCELSRTSLEELSRAVVGALQEQAEQWGVKLQVDVPGEAWVQADAPRLERVIWNLVGNALKFSPTDSTVRIAARRDGAQWLLEVEDQGPGLDQDAMAHVFEAYWRGAAPEPGRPSSTGLGLYISRGLVEAQEGTIGVENLPATGARFWVKLPGSMARKS